jgi:16S rRNA (guanine1207-N2)-methyltransferase
MEHYFTNNENLKSDFRSVKYVYKDTPFVFTSDLGVFSKDKIDYGSKSLLEKVLEIESTGKKILDVGCGYGFIGIVLSKILDSTVDMVDVNKRALHLTQMNIKNMKVNAECFLSDAYKSVTEKYDIIITNPPIRAGKDKVLEILLGAKGHLNIDGTLYYVIRKDQGAKSITKVLSKTYKIELLEKNKGFYIYSAKL